MEKQLNNTKVSLMRGDITEMETQAIVNAANERLAHGGGVAGAISRKGGPIIQRESDEWLKRHGNVPTGSAAITSGGNLKAEYVIHAVGPVFGSGDEEEKLANATLSALRLAEENGITSIAFPAISTGIFGYPLSDCAKTMLSVVYEHVRGGTKIDSIVFCLWDQDAFVTFENELRRLTDAT